MELGLVFLVVAGIAVVAFNLHNKSKKRKAKAAEAMGPRVDTPTVPFEQMTLEERLKAAEQVTRGGN